MSAFVALTVSSALRAFCDPLVFLFAIACAVMGRVKIRPHWPFFFAVALTAFGAVMARFVWHALEALQPDWVLLLTWRLYIYSAIGYVAYGIFRIAYREPNKASQAS